MTTNEEIIGGFVDLRLRNAAAAAKLRQALLALNGKLPPGYPPASLLVEQALDCLDETEPLGNPDRRHKRALKW